MEGSLRREGDRGPRHHHFLYLSECTSSSHRSWVCPLKKYNEVKSGHVLAWEAVVDAGEFALLRELWMDLGEEPFPSPS